jgi:Ca-activated chloride channel family protein
MHIQTDRALVPALTPVLRYLQVVINAPAHVPLTGDARLPVNVALVLDRSGSMAGRKIEMARAAVQHAVHQLASTDGLGVVCYDNEVTTVLEQTRATPEAKRLALDRLARIDARGATNLCGGWITGAAQARPDPGGSAGVSKVMLLTDGRANQGIVDHEELRLTAKRLRAEGVLTSTFGVGSDFDEVLLSGLAVEGGGHFYFIEHAQQIPDFFASELGETLEVAARDAAFEIVCDPGVEATIVNDLPHESSEGRLRVRLGNLVSDQEVTLIVAVAFKGAQPHGASLGVQCRVTDSGGVLHAQPIAVMWRAVEAPEDSAQVMNHDVRVAAAALLAERARAAALDANRRHEFDDAQRILREMGDDLRAMAPGDTRVLAIIDALHHDEMAFADEMSPRAMKARHFASYSIARSRAAGGTARRTKPPQ